MAIFEFHIEPGLAKRLVAALERIAVSLEHAYPVRKELRPGSIGLEALTKVSDEKLWERQMGMSEEGSPPPAKASRT
jgi:hypothetical protein